MKISINEPCHENWDAMTPNDKGAFCLSCQKNVVDFSNKTLTQIKDFFKRKTGNESVCARFDEQQLNALTFDDFFSKFLKWKYFQKAALIVFFVFGMSLFGKAQNSPKDIQVPVMGKVAYVPKDTVKKCQTDSLARPIKGKVKYKPADPKKKQASSQRKMGEVAVENKNNK